MPLESYVTTYPASLGRHPDVLRVPVNKTSISFEKAPDFAAGEAVQEWERVRPDQPLLTDVKTGERVQFLFMYRCQRIGKD